MAFAKTSTACALIVFLGFFLSTQAGMQRRAAVKGGADQNKIQEQDWEPATGTREYTVNVKDKINGANQYHHEKWNNGTVEGSYAAPGRDGKWLKVNYKADSEGFRITSTENLDADKVNTGEQAKDHTAHIDIQTDGNKPVEYTVTEDQLKASNKQNQNQPPKSQQKQ